jgi:hypothetical protein
MAFVLELQGLSVHELLCDNCGSNISSIKTAFRYE